MKAVFVTGSARRGGTTDILCGAAADSLRDEGHSVDVFRAYDMDIGHCTNCGRCSDGICAIDDDMVEIYDAIRSADIIVMCTPVHFSGVSSILKQAIDRLQCFWVRPDVSKRRVFGLIACGGSEHPCFKNIISVCKAVANTLGAEWGGEFTVPGTDSGPTEDQVSDAGRFGKMLSDLAGS